MKVHIAYGVQVKEQKIIFGKEKMYVTRPLSMFQKNPSALSWPPPEGPNSGILVIEDEEAEQQYTCFGLCKSDELKDLPFPQNKNLKLRYSSGTGEHRHVSYFYANLIPVLNQPLSSNRYYVIKRRGSHKGYACLYIILLYIKLNSISSINNLLINFRRDIIFS